MINRVLAYKSLALSIFITSIYLITISSDIETKIFSPSVLLPDGGRYYGELKDNLFSGKGKIVWKNGASYQGQFQQGLFHGFGIHKAANGTIYEGQFVEGVFTGQGEITLNDGAKYKGEVKNYQFNGHGRWDFEEGSYYVGQFKNGRYEGYGLLNISEGDVYNGTFEQGHYHGDGEIHYSNGDIYRGHFNKDKWHGKGIYISADKHIYEGSFFEGKLNGQGIYIDPEGNRYEGGFKDWRYEGKGLYNSNKGDLFKGDFVAGSFTGKGIFKAKDGRFYEGEFKDWAFNGQGILLLSNGDRYEGQFSYGNYNGSGILTYAAPVEGKTGLTGIWRYGRYIGDGSQPDPRELNTEKALYVQNQLLENTIDNILETDQKQIKLYFVGIASDGKQDVFYKEVRYVQQLFDDEFDTKGRSAILVNNPKTIETIPLATVTSVEMVLTEMAKKMDSKKDILFLYLTSHGSKTHKISIDQHGLSLPDLSAKRLAEIIKPLPIRWKVVVISACYSGGFIPFLKDEHTLIMTAAAFNRTSFGCSDKADMTYFGRAFFKEALTDSSSFEMAFKKAKKLVYEWEEKEMVNNEPKHSNPQIFIAKPIRNYLKKWFEQQSRNAKLRISELK